MEKKKSFFDKVARVVTGKTKEQRHEDAIANQIVKQKELLAYRKERIAQAGNVGRAKARIQTKARIKQLSQPKSTGLINLGTWGKAQQGFDPFTFGNTQARASTTPAKKKKGKKTPSVDDYLKSIPK